MQLLIVFVILVGIGFLSMPMLTNQLDGVSWFMGFLLAGCCWVAAYTIYWFDVKMNG